MKEFIQKNGDEVAIVIYDAPLPPKYFKLTKKFIRTLFVVVPVLLVLLFFGLFSWGLGVRLNDAPAPSLPSVTSESDTRVMDLESEIKNLQVSNQELADKLANKPSTSGTTEEPFLMFIKKPYGMQNLLSEKKVNLDLLELVQDSNRISLKFSIISANPETKVTGHVLVFMISDSGILTYPKEVNSSALTGMKYSSGEPFAVSRLRPTKADFDLRPVGESVKFVIYIFSREGDLLMIRETEPFKLGAK